MRASLLFNKSLHRFVRGYTAALQHHINLGKIVVNANHAAAKATTCFKWLSFGRPRSSSAQTAPNSVLLPTPNCTVHLYSRVDAVSALA